MEIFLLKSRGALLAVIVMAALFLISVFLGLRRGHALAQAQGAYQTASELSKGLENFFSDQSRYPTAAEFSDAYILLTYFFSIPDNTSTNAACGQNFDYKRLDQNSYELDFCLAEAVKTYKKGWNKITVSK